MSVFIPFVTVVHVILCVFIVLVVLIQQGKGAEISASFGGSSQTVFGSSGGANFFTMFTGVCAALFMITSVFLAVQGGSKALSKSVMDVAVPANQAAQGASTSQMNAHAQSEHPAAPDAATQNALSPATALQNGAEAGPQGAAKKAPATPKAAVPAQQ